MALLAEIRQRGYVLMARAFSRPEGDSYLEEFLQQITRWCKDWSGSSEDQPPPVEIQSILQEVTDILCPFKKGYKEHGLLALEVAYNRLFYGPGRPLIPPYASAYIHPRGQSVMAQPAIDALKLYRREGLEIAETFYDLPDHLILELEFMSFLCEQEVFADLPEKWWEKQYQFLSRHILWWLPSFVDSLQEHAAEPLYPSLARLLLRWIKADLRYLKSLLGEGALGEKKVSPDNQTKGHQIPGMDGKMPLRHGGGILCPPLKQEHTGKERTIWLHIKKEDCSFCGICSLQCLDGALEISLLEEEVQLNFYPARCSGCFVCIENCPEKALQVLRKGSPGDNREPTKEILVRSPLRRCQECGGIIPLPGQAYVLHKLGQEGERDLLLSLLQLCERCRGRKLIPGLGPPWATNTKDKSFHFLEGGSEYG
ncbi:MAG: hypothetical protein A3G93_09170 [Nitrospinae bacterium RIFCSPLOWO2_12_FULL_45_22]|nr:MAG: hypothetical protein A3G93_09170 [Nitrospinae bacterium RIFCSPLOWO2_12_FULL_45_22]